MHVMALEPERARDVNAITGKLEFGDKFSTKADLLLLSKKSNSFGTMQHDCEIRTFSQNVNAINETKTKIIR